MKAIPSYFYLFLVGAFLGLVLIFYNFYDFKSNEKTAELNEIVSTQVMENVDLGLVKVQRKFHLNETRFEEKVSNHLKSKYGASIIHFDYLKNYDGSLKAIKITMTIDNEKFTTTYKVNEV